MYALNLMFFFLSASPLSPSAHKRGESSSLPESAGDQDVEGALDLPILLTQQLQRDQLNLLSEKVMTEAVTEFVDKSEKEAISE